MLYANARMRQDSDSTHARTVDGTVRLTVPEAAAAMGISAEAVRARIKRKTLTVERDAAGTVLVVLDADLTRQDADGTGDGTDEGTGMRALLAAKDETIAALREQLARAEERDRENRRLLAAALERIPAIEAPPDTPSEPRESPVSASEEEDKGEGTPPDEGRRSWWQRFFG